MPITIRQVVSDSLSEIGVLSQGESLDAGNGAWALSVLKRILNEWNADRLTVYAEQFLTFTLVPNLSPHTIGPTGTFVVTQRPVSLDGCNLVLPTDVNTPVAVRDYPWWLGQSTPDISTTVPTDVYYEPTWPNGTLQFWPVPIIAYDVTLMVRLVLDDDVALTDEFTLPPGYQNAITLTLAEALCTSYTRPYPPGLQERATKARARVFANNDVTPRLMTRDAGVPGGGESLTRTTFNYLNRSF